MREARIGMSQANLVGQRLPCSAQQYPVQAVAMVSGFVLLASGSVEKPVQIDHANADGWHLALLLGLAALAQSLDDL